MRNATLALCLILIVCVLPAAAEDGDETAAITAAALDYLDGWYAGSAERMGNALEPALAKRSVVTHPKTGRQFVQSLSREAMIEYTRGGGGSSTPKEKVHNEIEVLDVYGGIATVKAVSVDFVDYLHLAKINGEWKIVNVLWERLPEEESP